MQDNTHPKAREDINSLSMASTFFRTLIPGGGSHKYALFMAQMSVNFERIARAVLEKNEKAARNRDEHASHDQTTTESTQYSNVSSAAGRDEDSSNLTTPDQSTLPRARIPHVEDFPHNIMPGNPKPEQSSAYVLQVPTAQSLPTTNPSYDSTNTNTPSNNNSNISSIPEVFNTATTNPNMTNLYPSLNATPAAPTDNDMYDTTTTGILSVPNVWHIPLTADWEFPNPFMSGLMGNPSPNLNLNPPPPPPTGPGANIPGYPLDLSGADTGLGLGSASAPPGVDNNMDYDYTDQMSNMMPSQAQTQAQVQAQVQAQAPHPMMESDLAWYGGFF